MTFTMVRFICSSYVHGQCKDEEPQACEHHVPSVVCNDPFVVCDDGSPTRHIPVLADTDNFE